MDVSDMAGIALTFVLAGVALSISAQILDDVSDDVDDATATAAVGNATEGVGELSAWLPTIGLVIAAAIIIGVIFTSFGGLAQKR